MHISKPPKISIVTPSFNQGKYIRETIDSVLSQGYPNIEYIIVDGASTDDTMSIVNEYQDKITHIISEPDNGQSHAINKGFAKATGDILCWLNSDDQFAPNALWSAAMAFCSSQADMIAGICEVYEDGELVHRHMSSCSDGLLPLEDMLDLDNGWNAGQFFYQPEVFFSKELWKRAGSHVREDCYYSMDYELWCRFAYAKASIHVIGTPLVHFRTHSEQKTADPKKFKAELVKVRDQFCLEREISWTGSKRPAVNWTKKLKVVLLNDIGYQYGAGIAQMRIAGAFEFAGNNVAVFDLSSAKDKDHYTDIIEQICDFEPHLVILGNIHAVEKISIRVVEQIENKFPCYWLTHDFWLLTGRCAYTGNCDKYKLGCDNNCPTYDQYPVINKAQIKPAWEGKQEFLKNSTQFNFLANSAWAKAKVESVLQNFENQVNVNQISLGAPTNIYKVTDTKQAREQLGISENQFVLSFSVSSLSDERKGGKLLIDALNSLVLDDITLILIGRLDVELALPKVNILKLGYTSDVNMLVNALNASDLYVGPSLEETFGQVFVEAALCGTPSIGFDVSGVKDSIKQGITGVRVKELSAQALAKEIEMLYNDRKLLDRMSKTAPLYAKNEFSLEASYASFYQVINKQGLIDKWGVPHKISFASHSHIVKFATRGWQDYTLLQKVSYKGKAFVNWLIGVLPNGFTAKVAQILPNKVEKLLIRWLVSK